VTLAGEQLGYPFMLKTRKLAYDGRGNFVVRSREDATYALKSLGCGNGEKAMLYGEKWVPFTKELAVMVVRGKDGEVRSYPPVETIHRNSICHLVFAPLRATDPKVCSISFHPMLTTKACALHDSHHTNTYLRSLR